MVPRIGRYLLFLAALTTFWSQASACDLCALFSASEAQGQVGKGFYLGLAEQFTHFGTLQRDGQEVPNPAGQFLDSSITQLLLSYHITERFGLELSTPYIYRSFRRPEGLQIQEGSESGLGDLSLLGTYQAYLHQTMHWTFSWNVLGGVKFPTGSTSRLAEETHEMAGGPIPSGIHGHDLTLGSGSYDGIIGTSLFGRWKRLFLEASVQYAIRSRGDFGYEFANDTLWSGGPGVYLLLNDNYTLTLQANTSGETKGLDDFRGQPAEDTGITGVYLGPQLQGTWRDKLSAQLGLDWSLSQANTALQIVPDYRVRASATWHF